MYLLQPVVCFLILAVNVDAEYQFKAGIHHYNNSRHLARQFRFNGDCCDACDNPCDNRFVFCLREFEAPLRYTVLEERHCPLGRYSTDVIAPDNDNMEFVLGQNLYDEVPNPLVFSGSQWMGGVQLAIQVFDVDYDFLNPEDYVDAYYINLTIPVGHTSPRPQPYKGLHGISDMVLSFELSCSEHYYGPQCDIVCRGQNDAMGHYTCSANGSIVCNEGYQNPAVNCTECTMSKKDCCANQCHNGGTCVGNEGEVYGCQCAEGYEGASCELEIDECSPNPCWNGRCLDLVADYTCRCPAGFNGKNCTELEVAEFQRAEDNKNFNASTFGAVLGVLVAVVIALLAVVVILQVAALRRARRERRKILRNEEPDPNRRLVPEEREATFRIYNATD